MRYDENRIAKRYKETRSIFKVADIFGCSHTHVLRVLRKHGIERGPQNKKAKILSDLESMSIGDSIDIPTAIASGLYARAKKLGISIRCKRNDGMTTTTCWKLRHEKTPALLPGRGVNEGGMLTGGSGVPLR